MKKGLRPLADAMTELLSSLNYCPDEEGIKTPLVVVGFAALYALNYCPDEEGIKTRKGRHNTIHMLPLNYCPDEEGIKTPRRRPSQPPAGDFELLP